MRARASKCDSITGCGLTNGRSKTVVCKFLRPARCINLAWWVDFRGGLLAWCGGGCGHIAKVALSCTQDWCSRQVVFFSCGRWHARWPARVHTHTSATKSAFTFTKQHNHSPMLSESGTIQRLAYAIASLVPLHTRNLSRRSSRAHEDL